MAHILILVCPVINFIITLIVEVLIIFLLIAHILGKFCNCKIDTVLIFFLHIFGLNSKYIIFMTILTFI